MEEFFVRDLNLCDLDVVFGVYDHVNQHVAHGFLASRKRQFFETVLADSQRYIALGVWCGHELVGYSLSGCVRENPYRSVQWIAQILAAKQAVYRGFGLVIMPEYQGKSLGGLLVNARSARLAQRGVEHFVGAIAVENLPSIASFLGEGRVLVGLESDELCLNYVVYSGQGINFSNRAQRVEADFCDLVVQQRMFDSGWVAGRLIRARSHAPVLSFLLPEWADAVIAHGCPDVAG